MISLTSELARVSFAFVEMATAKSKQTGLWSLSLSGTQSQPSSSESEEYTVVRDEELGVDALFLKVGREPARSKRTGEVYDKPVVGVRRNKDKMEVSKLHCFEFRPRSKYDLLQLKLFKTKTKRPRL